jgi:hypothetical protein
MEVVTLITQEQLYRCFDQKLKWYLLDNGCKYLMVARSTTSDDKFWLFERTDNFEDLLKVYKLENYKN